MSEANNRPHQRTSAPEDDVTPVLHKLVSHDKQNHQDQDDSVKETEEGVRLHFFDGEDAEEEEEKEEETAGKHSLKGGGEEMFCPPAFCLKKKRDGCADKEKPATCVGLGLFYAFIATVLFSIISLLVKTIQDLHSIEISAIRCFFQMLFIMPLLIYNKIGFLGPRDQWKYLVLRGFFGSNAMIMLFYAVQHLPLADATVIMFSNPVFTSLLAWIFLKEKCTIWDCVFTIFTLAGVILIARPPFLFGKHLSGIEGSYTGHVKGTLAAIAGAIGAAITVVVLRKMGKSVHYFLSVWYYAVIGFIETTITVSALGEWKIPNCGRDRWLLMLIALLGIAGQSFLVKALQTEKAGPVSLMRTVDVLLAFFFQFVFFNLQPTWWALGGALCIVTSTSGVALRNWYANSHKS